MLCRPDMHTRGCSREAACQWRDAPARLTPWLRAGLQSEHAGRPALPASPAGPPARSGLRGVWGTQSRAWACENTAQRAQEVRVFGGRVDKCLACLPAPRTRAPPPTGPHPAGCGPVCGRCRTPAPPGSSRPPAAVEVVKEGQRSVRLRASHTGLHAEHPVCSLERTGRWHTAVTSACRSESIFWRCCTANADDAIGGRCACYAPATGAFTRGSHGGAASQCAGEEGPSASSTVSLACPQRGCCHDARLSAHGAAAGGAAPGTAGAASQGRSSVRHTPSTDTAAAALHGAPACCALLVAAARFCVPPAAEVHRWRSRRPGEASHGRGLPPASPSSDAVCLSFLTPCRRRHSSSARMRASPSKAGLRRRAGGTSVCKVSTRSFLCCCRLPHSLRLTSSPSSTNLQRK